MWKFSFNELNEDESQSESTETYNDKIQNKNRTDNKYSTKHTIQRERKNKLTTGIINLMTSG